jgi:putative ABC transport system substrate-binding protein
MQYMNRREFITLLGGAAVSWPLAVRAQQADRLRLVGILMPFPESDAETQTRLRACRQELAKLGWSEGRNVQFDERLTTDNMDLVRAAAANLVDLNSDVIVSAGDRVISILTQLTRSIPIVALASDLAGSGFVESVARPGGNVTGFSVIEFSIIGKMLEALKRIAPGVSRVGMMHNPDNPVGAAYLRSFETVARQLAVQPINFPVHGLADIERAIGTWAEQPNGGILIPPDVTMSPLRPQIIALVAQHRVPTIYSNSSYVISGGLVSRHGSSRPVSAASFLRRPRSARRETGHSANSAANEVPVRHQPQRRQGTRSHHPARCTRNRRRGD